MGAPESIRGGKARFFIKPEGATSEIEVLFTTGPFEFAPEHNPEKVMCNEYTAPVMGIPNEEGGKLSVELLDTQLSFIKDALAAVTYASNQMAGGGITPKYHQLRLEWLKSEAAATTVCSLTIFRAMQEGSFPIQFERGKARTIKVEYAAYADTTKAAGVGNLYIFDDAATATAAPSGD